MKNSAPVKNSAGNRLIVMHTGSEDKFVPDPDMMFKASCTTGNYHRQMNNKNFEK